MRKSLRFTLILSILFGIGSVGIVSNAFAYATDGKVANIEGSGSTAADPVRVYQLVRYGESGVNNSSLTEGDVVIWDIVSDDGVSVNLVGTAGNPAVSNDAVAGVVVSPTILTQDATGNTAVQDIGRRNWGYIQTYGLNTAANISVAAGACTASNGLRASGAARNADCIPAGTPTQGGGATLGFTYDTVSATGTDNEIFIRVR